MDLRDLAAYLAAQQGQAIAAENPYFKLQAAPEIVTSLASQFAAPRVTDRGSFVQPQQFKTKDLMTLGIGGGLLSGLLGGIGEQHQDTLTERYKNALFSQMQGGAASPEGLSPSLFRQTKNQASLFRLQNAAAQAERQTKADEEFNKHLLGQGAMVQDGQIVPIPQLAEIQANTAALKKAAEEGASPTRLFGDTTSMRKEVEGSDPYKSYVATVPIYQSMINSLNVDSRAADLDYVYGLAKIMDPGSVVRESETGLVKSSNPLVQQTINELYSQLSSKGALDIPTRKNIIQAATSRVKAYQDNYNAYLKGKAETASKFGLDFADIAPTLAEPDFNFGIATQPTTATPSQADARAILRARGVPGY